MSYVLMGPAPSTWKEQARQGPVFASAPWLCRLQQTALWLKHPAARLQRPRPPPWAGTTPEAAHLGPCGEGITLRDNAVLLLQRVDAPSSQQQEQGISSSSVSRRAPRWLLVACLRLSMARACSCLHTIRHMQTTEDSRPSARLTCAPASRRDGYGYSGHVWSSSDELQIVQGELPSIGQSDTEVWLCGSEPHE